MAKKILSDEEKLLIQATEKGDLPVMEKLLSMGLDINTSNSFMDGSAGY